MCAYIGSQNLYVCDLAEWGVVIDNADAVKKMMEEFWNPLWAVSYTGQDCDVQRVMDGLALDRDGKSATFSTAEERKQKRRSTAIQTGTGSVRGSDLYLDVGDLDK